MICYFSF